MTFPSDMEPYRRLLRERFGYPELRSGQEEVLRLLPKRDTLAVMPTGSGKSMCYVLPALISGRVIVVSPLIALMQDQVDGLRAAGVAAAYINSNLDRAQQNRAYLDFIGGRINLLYVAPERFANDRFVEGLREANVNLLAVDEAHCISEWGHDFRPDYLTLGSVRERLGSPRTLALTATAEPRVRQHILDRLGIGEDAALAVNSVDRPNLKLNVLRLPQPEERRRWLLEFLQANSGQSGIVYARARKSTDEIAAELQSAGISAAAYHAGMDRESRTRVQQQFNRDEVSVIVATTAFGMGVDKPDVRFVVHFNMPGSIESYYQEIGRAGRDGEPAEGYLLVGPRDIVTQRFFIDKAHPTDSAVRTIWRRLIAEADENQPDRPNGDHPDEDGFTLAIEALRGSGLIDTSGVAPLSTDPHAAIDMSSISRHQEYADQRLRQMIEYSETSECRRAIVLRYFGEDAQPRCSSCDNCLGTSVPAIAAAHSELYDELLTLRDELAAEFDRAPYQLFEYRTARELASYRPTSREELMETWGIGDTKAGWFGDRVLRVVRLWEEAHPDAQARQLRSRAVNPPLFDADERDDGDDDLLYQRLRQWRRSRAREDGVPAYVVSSNRTLRAIAAIGPGERSALQAVWGLGPAKLSRYGDEILAVVNQPIEG
jgi:ATP-dependent DNA helicase RecQ